MKPTTLSLTAALLFASANALTDYVKTNVRNSFGDDRVVRINKQFVNDDLRRLMEDYEVDHFGHHEAGPEVKLTKEAIEVLKKAEVEFEDTTESWINHFESNFADPNFFCTADDCAKRDTQSFYQSYQTLEAIHARIDDLAADSNGLATVGSVGSSYEGRDLKIITISDDGVKPIVFYQCNIHAREWLPPMYCTYMAETLLKGHPLLDVFTFVILPSLNPDGYVYSYTTNQNWRKTRKPTTTNFCIGTDGNRNWDSHHCGEGASTNPCAETYCGDVPFSEPETAAVRDWGLAHADRVFAFADIHSYGGYWMSPIGWTYDLPPVEDYSRMEQCFNAAHDAVQAVNGLDFIVGSSSNAIYIAAGGSDDWFYEALGVIYANSVELRGNSFQPAASNIIPSNEEIFAGMVAELGCAIKIEFNTTLPATPTVAPTPEPTPAPTECKNWVPNGIKFANGDDAPCDIIEIYCAPYDFVRERCPETCGTCEEAAAATKDASSVKVINSTASEATSNLVYIVAPVGAAVLAGLVAALVVLSFKKQAVVAEKEQPVVV